MYIIIGSVIGLLFMYSLKLFAKIQVHMDMAVTKKAKKITTKIKKPIAGINVLISSSIPAVPPAI